MGNLGGGEILVILLAALIFLGPEKLPEVARQIGKALGEVRKVSAGFQREVQDAMRMVEDAVSAGERERPTPPAVAESTVDPSIPTTAAIGATIDTTATPVDPTTAVDHTTTVEPTTTADHTAHMAEPSPPAGSAAVAGPPSAEPPLPAPAEPATSTPVEPATSTFAAPSHAADVAHGGDR
jgi:sec-independent protein translocase protein TatB